MFADDTVLLASSRKALIQMIKETIDALEEHGLALNLEKCKVQTNKPRTRLKPLAIGSGLIPMVRASDGFPVLGTIFTLIGRTSAELCARASAAWGKFHQLWPLLGRRDSDVTKRLRLFDMCVGQTALWCNGSWVLTLEEKRRLASTQNYMLRRIAGPNRAPEELWIDWVKRSTRVARKIAIGCCIRAWPHAHILRKWSWAGHVARMETNRLSYRATAWRDAKWAAEDIALFGPSLSTRRAGRQHWFRWEDDLLKYAEQCGWQDWKSIAANRNDWQAHAELFWQLIQR